jgi:protein NEDD1
MLAVCTTVDLILLDSPTLKRAPTSVLPTHVFPSPPTACAWTLDNSTLFVAYENNIHRFDSAGTSLGTVPVPSVNCPVTALVSKDKGNTIILSSQDQIAALDVSGGKVASQLDTHTSSVSGLALSPDATLMAFVVQSETGAASEVHVHSLSAALHIEVEGLPRRGDVTACAFHVHSKAKLLLAVGTQLLVYDATKPTTPIKTIALDRKSGEAVAISCSPFSKTLVAVGCSSGMVNLVDLDKEKG